LIFKVGNDFYQLNQLEKEFKRPQSVGPDFGPRPSDIVLAQQPKRHDARFGAGHRALGGRGGAGISGLPVD
jgi:hypothetical protein